MFPFINYLKSCFKPSVEPTDSEISKIVLLFFDDFKKRQEPIIDEIVSKEYDVFWFNKIHVNGKIKVVISKNEQYVRMETNKSILPLIKVKVEDETLHIHSDYDNDVTVFVSVQSLTGLTTEGLSSIYCLDKFESNAFNIDCNDTSYIAAWLSVNTLNVDINGLGHIEFSKWSKATNLNIHCGGTSKFSGAFLKTKSCVATSSSMAFIIANVSKSLDVFISGCSTFKYYGNPSIKEISVSGMATVENLK
jgi:hypothetical protein